MDTFPPSNFLFRFRLVFDFRSAPVYIRVSSNPLCRISSAWANCNNEFLILINLFHTGFAFSVSGWSANFSANHISLASHARMARRIWPRSCKEWLPVSMAAADGSRIGPAAEVDRPISPRPFRRTGIRAFTLLKEIWKTLLVKYYKQKKATVICLKAIRFIT